MTGTLTMVVLEAVLNQEIAGHLRHDRRAAAGSVRNKTWPRTVVTEVTLEPMIFAKFVRVVLCE